MDDHLLSSPESARELERGESLFQDLIEEIQRRIDSEFKENLEFRAAGPAGW